ncbi:MAG: MJ1477/TM1410 family putative glycoside hydrolase [Hyphomicrobium sp.]
MIRLISLALALFAITPAVRAEATAKTRATVSASNEAAASKAAAQRRKAAMAAFKTWAIQLRFLDRTALAASPFDLVVIDHAPHPKKDIEIPFTRDEIAPLKIKPDGSRRIVLAYLSMGEAERYRYYWQPQWDAAETRPKWLGPENPQWAGNYQVQFADPDWQTVIFGTQMSVLDRIIAAGFDGVYLDRVDAFQDVEATMPGAEDAMTGFVQRLADHAHRINPDFLIVMQNAEELAKSKSLLARLDGISKEDLLYGFDNGDGPNPQQMVTDTVNNLRKAKRAGLKVMVLEYARTAETIAAAQKLATREGYVLHITDRMLGVLSPVAPLPAPSAGDPPAAMQR